ncbi:hypothetical protein [Micromonospora chersina]|uniref:hypothetical protein n=1 Tax=Micromonospora chersina TaxID=47854 RepID=UPI0033F8BD78
MTIDRPIPATELLDTADLLVSVEAQRIRLGGILAATAEALRLPLNGDLNAIPARAAATYDSARNLREQLNRATTGRQQLQEQLDDMASQRDEALECRDVIRRQLNIEKSLVRGLQGQLASAHAALRNLAQAYADTGAIHARIHEQEVDDLLAERDAYEPPLPGVGLWEHDGVCPPAVAEQGCDDCSVEPGERHRHRGCPGNERAAARTEVAA